MLFVAITGTLLHFVYDWSGQNPVVGLIAPVNESTWEHLKLLFFPMLVYSLWEYVQLKDEYPCILSASALGILAGLLLIPTLFYTYSGIIGRNFTVIDILIFFIAVVVAFLVQYSYASSKNCLKNSKAAWLLVVLMVAFFLFTGFPPSLGIFVSPV